MNPGHARCLLSFILGPAGHSPKGHEDILMSLQGGSQRIGEASHSQDPLSLGVAFPCWFQLGTCLGLRGCEGGLEKC